MALNVVGFDAWIKSCSHEATAARAVEPDVLWAGERVAKIDLGRGVKPVRLQQWAGSSITGVHHQLNERAYVRCGIANLGRPGEAATRMCADEVIDNVESQVGARQGLGDEIHGRFKTIKGNQCPAGSS